MKNEDIMTVSEFVDALYENTGFQISQETIRRWVRLGKLKGFKQNPFNSRTAPVFIPASELKRILKRLEDQKKELA